MHGNGRTMENRGTRALLVVGTVYLVCAISGIGAGTISRRPSNKANEFHLGFMDNYVDPYYAYITLNQSGLLMMTDEPNPVSVSVTFDSTEHMHRVQPGEVTKVYLRGARANGPGVQDKGIRIKAEGESLVSVYTMNEELDTVEGYTAFPCVAVPHVGRYDYYAMSVARTTTIEDISANSAFLIVACDDNTTVSVTPTQEIMHPDNRTHVVRPGQSFTKVLHENQTLYIESGYDLTGSHVVSVKPITLLSGHECGNVPFNIAECNYLVEQLPPTLMWGSEFLTAPTASRTSSDVFKILAAESDTEVTITCSSSQAALLSRRPLPNQGSLSMNTTVVITTAGDTINFTASHNEYCHVESTKAVLVVQFTPGHGADANQRSSDPFMVLVPAVSQYVTETTFTVLEGLGLQFDNYINIYAPATNFDYDSVLLNGSPIGRHSWVPILCASLETCGYAAQVEVNDSGVHHISCADNGTFGVTVYGLNSPYTIGYAYVGGLDLSHNRELMIEEPVQTSFMILAEKTVCLNCKLNLPYVDSSQIQWESGATRGSSFIDGRRVVKLANGTLCIRRANTQDSGTYTCSVGSDQLTYTVSVVEGIIVQPPTCRPQPTNNQTVLLGIGMSPTAVHVDRDATRVEICCESAVAGTAVTWLADGREIRPGQPSYGVGSNYLQIHGPFPEACIQYTCQAGSRHSESTEVCYGNFGPPTMLEILGPERVMEGNAFTISCTATGFPPPRIVWRVGSERTLSSRIQDGGDGALHVLALYGNDTDTRFCCVARNRIGRADTCRDIFVLVLPEIQAPPEGIVPGVIPVPPGATLPLPSPFNITIEADIGQNVTVVKTFSLEIRCTIARGKPDPIVSWLHNGSPISSEDYDIVSSEAVSGESLWIESVTPGRDNGTFTCMAEISSVGSEVRTTTVTVVEPPLIAEPSSQLHAPGNCRDLTNVNTTIATATVGLNLCVLSGPESRLLLDCPVEEGVPPPTIQWFKDGNEITSNTSGLVMYSNGTLEFQGIPHPIESGVSGQPGTMGLYTCFLTNLAGVANSSSYIVPFGDILSESVAVYTAPIQDQLFDRLHHHISSSVVSNEEKFALIAASGKILKYEDYYPGYYFDGGEDTIPPEIMEKMFDLVDIIPRLDGVVTSIDDRDAGGLSMAYEFLIRELRVAPPEIDHDILTEARAHLQELVTDIAGESDEEIPRLSLYLSYKNKYYRKKLEVEDQIEYQKKKLPGIRFSQWYERNGIILQNEISHAYYEWDVYGNKNDTEAWLEILNLEDHSAPLNEANAVLFATARHSKVRDEKVYFPMEFYPSHWFNFLTNRVEESVEQLQYNLAELQAQKRVLEITNNFLEAQVRKRSLGVIWDRPSVINRQLEVASFILEHEVIFSEEQRYQCLITRNPIDCQLYFYEYEKVVQLMEGFADIYWEAEFVKVALDHRDVSIPLVIGALSSIENEIDHLELIIRVELFDEADRDPEEKEKITEHEYGDLFSTFSFSTKDISQSEQEFVISKHLQNRPLWYLDPVSTDLSSAKLLREYTRMMNHLNSMWTNVTAKYTKVDVHRRWFKPGLFRDSHFKLRNESILVSPGLVQPLEELASLLANSSYELPLYPSSLILATEIELFVNVPFPFYTIPTLLRLSYDRYVRGGFGPFSFGPLFMGKMGGLKFQVQIRDNGIVILLPGTQLIGYVCNAVPQHPHDATTSSSRRRRSAAMGRQSAEHGRNEEQTTGNDGVTSSKFGQWLSQRSKHESSGGDIDELRRGRGSKGQSSYSERIYQAVALQKLPAPTPLETFTVYSNESIILPYSGRNRGYKRRHGLKSRFV